MTNDLSEKLSAEKRRGSGRGKPNLHSLRDLSAEIDAFVEERTALHKLPADPGTPDAETLEAHGSAAYQNYDAADALSRDRRAK